MRLNSPTSLWCSTAWTSAHAVVQTGGVEIEISGDVIRLGQLLKFANIVTDGGEAKALIASGAVTVDGEPETRRGRQVGIGSRVEVDLPHGLQELRVVQQRPASGSLPVGDDTASTSERASRDVGEPDHVPVRAIMEHMGRIGHWRQ